MPNVSHEKLESYRKRASLPVVLKSVAAAGLVLVVLIVGIGFYLGSFRKEFRMKGLPARLSTKVIAEVEGFERRETDDGEVQYVVRADRAKTFEDQHQELENIELEVFDKNGARPDRIRARKAIYVPSEGGGGDFRVFFAGDVVIDTRDSVTIRTDQLTYTRSGEVAEAEEKVDFSGHGATGSSFGAIARIGDKTLELLRDVDVTAVPASGDAGESSLVRLRSGSAFIDQNSETIDLKGGVTIDSTASEPSAEGPTTIESATGRGYFAKERLKKLDLNGNVKIARKPPGKGRPMTASARDVTAHFGEGLDLLSMDGDVRVESVRSGSPSVITASSIDYDRREDAFDLRGNVRIETASGGQKTVAVSREAVYRQAAGRIEMFGGADVKQGSDRMSGDEIRALLFGNGGLKSVAASGNSYLRRVDDKNNAELRSAELNAEFRGNGRLLKATASGSPVLTAVPLNPSRYSRYRLSSPTALDFTFEETGHLAGMVTQGRTTIKLFSASAGDDSNDRILTADKIRTTSFPGSDDLATALATGNPELVIEPKSPGSGKYRTVIRSDRFSCDFYRGNNAKDCVGTGPSQAVRTPTAGNREPQYLNADGLTASFSGSDQDVAKLEAVGNARFKEGERYGTSERMIYTKTDDTVRLRGGDPTVWDTESRARAVNIDWILRDEKSFFSGSVSSAYFGRRRGSRSTPFSKDNEPVFISSERAAFDHREGSAVFEGDARAWQDKNYVRSDRLLIEEKKERFFAEGNVKSLLYEVKGSKDRKGPVDAQADSLLYLEKDGLLRYTGNADIKQGTDRIRAHLATVHLNDRDEVVKTIAEKDVVITQPGRRATGEYANYDVAAERIVLRGSPASVSDRESGSSEGKEIVVNLKDNSVYGSGRTSPDGAGRMRTVYKLKEGGSD